jgi:hypothetical protein
VYRLAPRDPRPPNRIPTCRINVFRHQEHASMGAEMIRTAFLVSAFLLAFNPAAHAEGRPPPLPDFGSNEQHLYTPDRNTSVREYEKIYRRNQRYVRSTLKSYSKHALGLIGIPGQTVDIMGAALGLVTNGAKLDLNKSKTLEMELKDIGTQDRVLYFGVNLDW